MPSARTAAATRKQSVEINGFIFPSNKADKPYQRQPNFHTQARKKTDVTNSLTADNSATVPAYRRTTARKGAESVWDIF